ncbi:MAG: hypothetical protein V3V18_05090, partial [Methylococcales bacterium]
QSCLKMFVEQEKWIGAASSAGSLSQLQLAQGNVSLAIKVAIQSLELADKSGDDFEGICNRTNFANAQHQAGDLKTAHVSFEKAESLQKQRQEEYPQLYALQGFQYCDLLLTAGEWRDVQKRAKQALEWANEEKETLLLATALAKLALGRARLQHAITLAIPLIENKYEFVAIRAASSTKNQHDSRLLPKLPASDSADDVSLSILRSSEKWLNNSVAGLRKAGHEDDLPCGLLARASYHRYAISFSADVTQMAFTESGEPLAVDGTSPYFTELHANYQAALRDLQEAHDIAQRSGMRLHLTDYHLESARLLLTRLIVEVDSHSLKDLSSTELELKTQIIKHMEQASDLIEETGYKRRTPELLYLQDCVAELFE